MLGQPGEDALAEIARLESEHRRTRPGPSWFICLDVYDRVMSSCVPPYVATKSPWASARVCEDQVIPLGEVTVGIHNGRFQVRWRKNGKVVIVRAGHMLTNFQAPQICRFLSDIMEDGMAQISMFDWGPASSYPFLPRVTSGRAILSPARCVLRRHFATKSYRQAKMDSPKD